jgi:ATP-dependent Clp protease adaptor protein ClpS
MVSSGSGTMGVVSIAPAEVERPEVESAVAPDVPWVTIVWNDPVNLITYVAFVFQEYFGYDRAKSEKLMLQVHQEGRSAVSSGSREEMERDVAAMHGYGLWATMQRDS